MEPVLGRWWGVHLCGQPLYFPLKELLNNCIWRATHPISTIVPLDPIRCGMSKVIRYQCHSCLYEPVQDEWPKFRQPRMPLAISNRMSHSSYHPDRYVIRTAAEEDGMASFSRGLRAGASGESVSRSTAALRKGQWESGASVGMNLFLRLFLNEPVSMPPRHVRKTIVQIFEDGPTLSHI